MADKPTAAEKAEAIEAQLRERARQLVADWPPLTKEQRMRIAVLLRPDLPVGIQHPQGDPPEPVPGPRDHNPEPPGREARHPTPTEQKENRS